ncbi:hypothetical protein [Treponema sp.]|uniref:hypothetical protein n=1 Tax=Treponema sp. TaxID=166 RepID=UPI0025F991D0|nr:hypothetical protein [Treponema sp.]MCR5218197.1 hypothetical protein [Treponema sp.]
MKKLLLLFTSLFLSLPFYSLSVKDYVCKVEASKSNEEFQMLHNLSLQLESYNSYSSFKYKINNLFEKTRTYGFTARLPDGKSYVISGSTFMEEGSRVKVTFYNSENQETVLDNLTITYTDRDYNLAFIELPESYKGNSCQLITERLEEDTDLYKVHISDNKIESKRTYITNNNSPAGDINSYLLSLETYTEERGCPVLIKKGGSFAVCGTITENNFYYKNKNKVRNYKNESTIVLPASYIQLSVNNFLNNASKKEEGDIEESVKNFIVQSDARELIPFVSNELMINYGDGMVKKYYGQMDDEENAGMANFFEEDPYTGVKSIFAYYMIDKLEKGSKNAYSDYSIEKGDKLTKVTFTNRKGKSITSIWKIENGSYKICCFESLEEEKLPKKFTRAFFNYDDVWNDYGSQTSGLTIGGGFFNLMDDDGLNKSINSGFVSFGGDFIFFGIGSYYQNEKAELTIDGQKEKVRMHAFGGYLRVQAPVVINAIRTTFVPYIEYRIGVANIHDLFWDKSCRVHTGNSFGLDLVFRSKQLVQPYLNFAFNSNSYNSKDEVSSFSAGGGIKLRFDMGI